MPSDCASHPRRLRLRNSSRESSLLSSLTLACKQLFLNACLKSRFSELCDDIRIHHHARVTGGIGECAYFEIHLAQCVRAKVALMELPTRQSFKSIRHVRKIGRTQARS